MASPENTPSAASVITKLQRDSLQVIATTAMIGGWALLIGYVIGYFATSDQHFISLIEIELVLGALMTLVWILQRRGQHTLSIWVLFISAFIIFAGFNFVVEGLGLTVGITAILIFSAIAWQTLPTRPATMTTMATFLAGAFIYFVDVNLAPEGRLAAEFLLQELIIVTGGIIFFILTINVLRGIEFNSIGAEIRASFFVISLIPVIIIALLQTLSLIDLLNTQANERLLIDATNVAGKIDAILEYNITEIGEDAKLPSIINLLENPGKDTVIPQTTYLRYEDVLSYGLLNKDGVLLLDDQGNSGGDESQTIYFQKAAQDLETYSSDMVLDPETGLRVYYVSAPIINEQENFLGVIRIKLNTSNLRDTIESEGNLLGPGSTVAIIDATNIVLAHTTSFASVGKSLIFLNLNDLAKALATKTSKNTFTSLVAPEAKEKNQVAFAAMQVKPWKVIVARRLSGFLVPMFRQLSTLAIIMVVVLVAVFFGANLTAALLATPINTLAKAAKTLGAGTLDDSIHLARKDELGTLSLALEDAHKQIHELLQTLEARVTERTAELSSASEKNLRRAAQLETISLVARSVTSLNNLNIMLPEITRQISESFGYYHVGIFLVDDNHDYAMLRASNSEGGKKMLGREHKLKVGREGIVGNVTNTGHYRIALDVGIDAIFFNNPDLPDTRSEIALPLQIGEKIIGALDVQSTEPDAFSEDDIKALTLLSDQISIAIENANLLEEARAALAQLQQIYSEAVSAGWQAITSERGTIGYRFAKGSVEPVHKKDDAVTPRGSEAIEIPILLRGEKLGALKIRRTGRQQQWSETETRLYQAIVDRVAFALENARLFSDARQRANLERLTSGATAKISSSVQFETILRTAAEEISRILEGSEVLVQIQAEAVEQSEKGKNRDSL